MQPFGAVLRLPLGFEVGPQLPIVLRVFVEDEDATGAQAVFEGVEANGAFPSGVFGPVDCWAFCRLASCCLSEMIIRNLLLGRDQVSHSPLS